MHKIIILPVLAYSDEECKSQACESKCQRKYIETQEVKSLVN